MNIRELLTDLNIPYLEHGAHHHTTEGWVQCDCFQCSPNSGRYKLGINLSLLYCSCWSCGRVSLASFLMESKGLRYPEVTKLLGTVDREALIPRAHTGKLKLPDSIGPLLPIHRKYLSYRGFDPDEIVALWRVGGIPLAVKHAWSLFIPVHLGDEIVSWTTRKLTDEGRRYIAAPSSDEAIPAKDVLYGAEHARYSVVIVEGATDVLVLMDRLAEVAVGPGAVATMGTAYTTSQLRAIAKYPKRAICFDREVKAQAKARQLASDLSFAPGETVNVILDAPDPGDADDEEIKELRKRYLS